MDLDRPLRLLLLEPGGESHSDCNEFHQRLELHPGLEVYSEQPVPDATGLEIERSLARARSHDVDAVLVWTDSPAVPVDEPEPSATSAAASSPQLVVDVAERVNLFDRCFLALVGRQVSRRDARHLGFEDGFMADMPLEELVERLMREAVTRARNPGSSPPCYL